MADLDVIEQMVATDPHLAHGHWSKDDTWKSCVQCKEARDKELDVCPTPQPLANAVIWRLEEDLQLEPGLLALEPSAGDGAFVRAMRNWSASAVISAFELRLECADALRDAGADTTHFLNLTEVLKGAKTEPQAYAPTLEIIHDADFIGGNPPFAVAEDHVKGLLEHMKQGAWLAFLLRLGFLGSKSRLPFWEKYPERYLYPISPRPGFKLNSKGKPGSDSQEYGIFVWQKGWVGEPTRRKHIIWDKPSLRRRRAKEAKALAAAKASEAVIDQQGTQVGDTYEGDEL